jgi:hypothetical protein
LAYAGSSDRRLVGFPESSFESVYVEVKFLTPGDPTWDACLRRAPHDFYHFANYCQLSAKMDGGVAEASVVTDSSDHMFFLPYIMRPLRGINWLGDGASGLFDLVSPYGYPGPLIIGDDDFLRHAIHHWCGAMYRRGCVSGFVRMHPMLNSLNDAYRSGGEIVERGRTVSVDLTLPAEKIWSNFRENHRRDIHKKKKEGLTASMEPCPAALELFAPIYYETMDRVGAGRYYYFAADYFQGLKEALGDQLSVCIVRAPDGSVLCGGIFTECDGIVQYHLGGTLNAALQVRPSKMMFDFVCTWGKSRGNRSLHLGGGFGAKEDSVFEFKAGFSPLRHSYFTWQLLFEPSMYQQLEQKRRSLRDEGPQAGFFPAYRG